MTTQLEFPLAVAQAMIELSFFEGYFEAKNDIDSTDAFSELRDRAGRARENLHAAFIDAMRTPGEEEL